MRLLLACVVALGAVAAAAAQVPDTAAPPGGREAARDTIPPPERTVPDTAATATPGTEPALGYEPPRWTVSFTLGTLGFGNLQTQPFLAERLDGHGTVLSTANLTRTVRADGGFQGTASGVVSLSRAWAARVGVGAARSTIGVRFSGTDDLFALSASRLADPLDATAWLLVGEAGLRYRVPTSTRARPYIELGVAALHWRPDRTAALPDLEELWRYAAYAAAGAVVPLAGPWRAELRAVRRLSRTPTPPSAAGIVGPSSSTLRLTAQPGSGTAYADVALELLSELRLDVGLSVGLGRLPPPDPPGTGARPSPSAL